MEIGLEPGVPTYSGGLGMLAGDTVRSAADLGVPLAAVSLLYRRGYFRQRLSAEGIQTEESVTWNPGAPLVRLDLRVTAPVAGREIALQPWVYPVRGTDGATVPVYLLDADLPENSTDERQITQHLYDSDPARRLAQESVLGIGGVRLLRALGGEPPSVYHMNEGHAALLVAALLDEALASGLDVAAATEAVRKRCVFTTHTPVSAGHDRFAGDLVAKILSPPWPDRLAAFGQHESLNMTELALAGSRYANGVAMRHGEVSRRMFPGRDIRAITNGVHLPTWVCEPMAELFDRHAPGWRRDPEALRHVLGAEPAEVLAAHGKAKEALIRMLAERGHAGFDREALTIVWARRATAYKRPRLLFADVDRLKAMARYIGPIQIVCGGKAHPKDDPGKEEIRMIHEAARALAGKVPVAYLENYEMSEAKILVAGADIWLNTPRPPLEASGTSGMKAAANGVPSLSVLDGWWIEGHLEGETGWAVGEYVKDPESPASDRRVANALYDKLSKTILPLYTRDREQFARVMRNAIAHNATFFNTHRMVRQYVLQAWENAVNPPLA